MSKTINPEDIPSDVLKEYVRTIQELYSFKVISYRKIKSELKELYGVDVDIDRIEDCCDDESIDIMLQHKHIGIIW